MEKSMREIADELGVDKQRVYRYIKKNHIREAVQRNGVNYYDEAAQSLIKQGFFDSVPLQESGSRSTSNEAVFEAVLKQLEMLQKELEVKNQQIADLNERLADSQKLLAREQELKVLSEGKILKLEAKQEAKQEEQANEEKHKPWWRFGKEKERH